MADLERALRELRVDWPETPDFAAALRPQLAPRPVRPRRRWAARIALALLALLGGAMAVEPARSAILEALGLKGVRIERREPTATPQPRGAALGEGLGLGTATTLDRARRTAGFDIGVPAAGLPAPDAVFADAGRVSFVYRARPGLPRSAETGAGLLVTQLRATVGPFIQKSAGPGTRIERFEIDGDPAFRLSGRPHGHAYLPEGGEVVFEEQRLAGPTLLVEHDGVLIRVEGRISRERAIAVARSVAAGAR